MRKQKQIWENEHATAGSMEFLASEEPSSAVVYFADYLKSNGVLPPKRVLDIGCGKGRNSVYLAGRGFEVYAVDYIQAALNAVKEKVKARNFEELVHVENLELVEKWPFVDKFFDLAVDCYSSIDIETSEGRANYLREMWRTLKIGGLAFVSVVSAQDEFEAEMIQKSPGSEKNSVIWPETGKFQKDYDVEEFREFYSKFEILRLEEVKKPARKLGRDFIATNILAVLRKSE